MLHGPGLSGRLDCCIYAMSQNPLEAVILCLKEMAFSSYDINTCVLASFSAFSFTAVGTYFVHVFTGAAPVGE